MKAKRSLLKQHNSTFLLLAIIVGVSTMAIAAPAQPSVTSEAIVTDVAIKPAPLSLIQVLAYALDHNPQRQAAWYAAKAAEARIGTAKADGGLQVNLNGSASRQYGFGEVGTAMSPGGMGSGGVSLFSQGWRESLSADATLPLYTGGRVEGNKKVAKYNYQATVAQAVGTEQDLVYYTTLNYLDILRNQQLVDVNRADLNVAKERYRIASLRYNAGAAAKLEVFRADTDQATAQNVVEAQNSLEQSYANLNTIMGREPQTPLQILPIDQLTLPQPLIANPTQLGKSTFTQSTLSAPAARVSGGAAASSLAGNDVTIDQAESQSSTEISPALASGQQLAQMANTSSPSLAALQAQVLAAEASVDVAKAGKKPSLGLSLGGLISNPISYLGRFVLSLGGSLMQNLFDSGRTSSQVRTARATMQQLKSSLHNGELNVANQIEKSLLSLNSAKEREVTTKTAVASAQEAMRTAQLGYAGGVQTSLDVIDAEAALLTAQTNAVNAKFDVAASQAQLAAAVGILTEQGQKAYQQSVALNKSANEPHG